MISQDNVIYSFDSQCTFKPTGGFWHTLHILDDLPTVFSSFLEDRLEVYNLYLRQFWHEVDSSVNQVPEEPNKHVGNWQFDLHNSSDSSDHLNAEGIDIFESSGNI